MYGTEFINIDSWLRITEINFTFSWLVYVLFIELWFIFPTQNVELGRKYKLKNSIKSSVFLESLKEAQIIHKKNRQNLSKSVVFYGNRTFPGKFFDYTMHCKINCI